MLLQRNEKLVKTKRYLEYPEFTSLQNSNIELSDEIIVFYNGLKNIIITKNTLLKYPVIYSKYYYENLSKDSTPLTEDISITYCPYTGASVIYYGKYRMTGEIYNNNIILENQETNNKIHQLTGDSVSDTLHKNSVLAFNKDNTLKKRTFDKIQDEDEQINKKINILLKCHSPKKISTKQMIIRNSISTFIDCDYLDLSDKKSESINVKPLVSKDYETSTKLLFQQSLSVFSHFPKMLVYGIEYVSRKLGDLETEGCTQIKHAMILSRNAAKYTSHKYPKKNYDYVKNGYKDYFNKVSDKLKNKGAIITPCYYFAWLTFYPNTKVIQLV